MTMSATRSALQFGLVFLMQFMVKPCCDQSGRWWKKDLLVQTQHLYVLEVTHIFICYQQETLLSSINVR